MKKAIIIFSLLLLSVTYADTTYPTNARYVIVNPNGRIKASSTFLLDTKTGKVWQLVTDLQNNTLWEQMSYDWYKQDGSYGGKTLKPPVITSP